MRIGVTFSPTDRWEAIVEAARAADEEGLEGVGFWDHYHSQRPEWSYITGWSAHAGLAMVTSHVRLVPMVLCGPNYLLGVLARESSVLAIISRGRFELGIGAGDYEAEFTAWGVPFPDAPSRVAMLEESIAALREIWQGKLVDWQGEHVRLSAAASTPAPPQSPRVVVGVGKSRRMIESAVGYADELNVYADEDAIRAAHVAIDRSARDVTVSVYRHFDYGNWPADLRADLGRWESLGVDRVFVNAGYGDDLAGRVRELAAAHR